MNRHMQKRMECMRIQKIQERKKEHNTFHNLETMVKRHCLNIECKHSYLSASHGTVYFTPEYMKHMKESYNERSYLGIPEHRCKYCNAMFWFEERNEDKNKHNSH